ncbi:CAAX protease self-immunity [Flavobacterium sp. ov086]|nr:CAAX protease self-immunity [Flavobacterium sp. ov086]
MSVFKLLNKDIQNVFFSPKTIEYVGLSSKLLFYYFFILTLVLMLFSIIVGSLTNFFPNESEIVIPKNITFFKVAIISPIIEEILFRLIILKNRFNYVLFFIYFLIYILYEKFVIPIILYQILVISFLFIIFFKKFDYKINISSDSNNSMLLRVYLSCLFFGIFHLTNFNHISALNVIIIAYLFSKFFAGFIFILLRIKFGIIASIALHVFLNSFSYILIY